MDEADDPPTLDQVLAETNLDKIKSEVWRELGVNSEDETAAKLQFAARFREFGMSRTDASRIRRDDQVLKWFSLSRLLDLLLRLGINCNIIIPDSEVGPTRGKLTITVKETRTETVLPQSPMETTLQKALTTRKATKK